MIREMTCVWEKLPPTSNRFASSAAPFGGDNWPSGQGLGSRGRDGNHLQVRGGRSALADRPDAEHTPAVPVPSLSKCSIAHRPRRHGPKRASNSPANRAEASPLCATSSIVQQSRREFNSMRTALILYGRPVAWFSACCVIAALTCAAEPGPGRGRVREIKNSLGMKLVFIPPGKFTMGSPESEAGREAQEVQHEVELTKGFYLGKHEVTVGEFKRFAAETKFQTDGERDGKGAFGINEAGKLSEMHAKFTWKSPGFDQTDNHPVVGISWSDAKAFCTWLSTKEKKIYRLATEAEWEYASRAGTQTAYAFGDNPEMLAENGNGADATARARYPGWSIGIKAKDGHIFTAPVGQFKANAFGLYDMHGNVWEWCEDWYEPDIYPKDRKMDPTVPTTGKKKVQRGGGWSSDSNRLRSAARVGRDPVVYRGGYLGFRVVVEARRP